MADGDQAGASPIAYAARALSRLEPGHPLAAEAREVVAQIYRPMQRNAPKTWVVSYPKAGVTWLRFMVVEAIRELFALDIEASVDVSRATSEAGLAPIRFSHNGGTLVLENGIRTPERAMFIVPWVVGFHRRRVLLLIRDPRDVTVSYFHQVTRRSVDPLDVGTIDDFYLDRRRGLRRTLAFYRRWERSLRRPLDIRVVRYESLRCADPTALAEALSFVLGIEIDRATAEGVYLRATPDAMRRQEEHNTIGGMRAFGSSRDDRKVRRAVVGGFRDELSPESVDAGDRLMRSMGFPFGYTC